MFWQADDNLNKSVFGQVSFFFFFLNIYDMMVRCVSVGCFIVVEGVDR